MRRLSVLRAGFAAIVTTMLGPPRLAVGEVLINAASAQAKPELGPHYSPAEVESVCCFKERILS